MGAPVGCGDAVGCTRSPLRTAVRGCVCACTLRFSSIRSAVASQWARVQPVYGDSRKSAERYGVGCAILVGDLVLTWSYELIHTAGLTPNELASLLPLLNLMRTEVMYGQYLDLAATGAYTRTLGCSIPGCGKAPDDLIHAPED